MKSKTKKIRKENDDSLFGLLLSYKSCSTYIRVLVSKEKKAIVVQLTDNPKNWYSLGEDRYRDYNILSRLNLGISKISIKYLTPEILVKGIGPLVGMKIPQNNAVIIDSIKKEGYYIIESSLRYKTKILQGIKKLLNLSPQKKYMILEKYLSLNQEK